MAKSLELEQKKEWAKLLFLKAAGNSRPGGRITHHHKQVGKRVGKPETKPIANEGRTYQFYTRATG